MAQATHPITAVAKAKQGKGSSRELRRNGFIPAVIYAKDGANTTLGIKLHDLEKALRMGHFFTTKQELVVDGKKLNVLARDIQRHPVTDVPVHIDFMAYNASQMVHANVAVEIKGQETSPGIKQGGVLQLIEASIEVVCRADSIPGEIVLDISALDIGESVHLSSIQLPEGVKPAVTDRDLTILSIVSTRTSNTADDEATDAAAAAAAEGAEGEKKDAAPAKEGEKKE
ncbi:MAG: 50S ribosomal protein L25/general stress protein Ctc [Pseudomonadaceae bacterium]|nr:50S ribosomal protein L25/general stress protein Ctc [Pseudomonadaceae bacterium]